MHKSPKCDKTPQTGPLPPTDGVMKDDSNKCRGDPPAVAL